MSQTIQETTTGQDEQGHKARHGALRGSFFRAVGHSLKCQKLGSLLVAAGLATPEQLRAALDEQKRTGEQLGRVLVRHGVVSAVQIYRKLAEQWCIRASAAGMALMMQTGYSSSARAEEGLRPEFTMAAASITPSSYRPERQEDSYPGLFGTQEVRSTDISAFHKWTTVITRFEEQMKTRASSPKVMMWKSALQDLKAKPVRAQIEGVNDYINKVRYIEDKANWQKSDYWATPIEFFSRGGDCEDFAIAKYASLRALGFTTGQLRIAIVQDTWKNIAHAVLVVYTDEGAFVLDNQNKRVESASDAGRYQPIFSINSKSWWLHKKTVS